jgi:hypothetical protein
MRRDDVGLRWAALEWLVRLPLLGADELAQLLGLGEIDAVRLLSDLERTSWLESVRASSPELESDRLHALSTAGLRGLTQALNMTETDL